MRHPALSTHDNPNGHENTIEQVRHQLVQAIEALPSDVQLLQHLLTVIRVATSRGQPLRQDARTPQHWACLWVALLLSWQSWFP